MSRLRVSLAGVDLSMRRGDSVSWTWLAGVQPYQTELVVDAARAEKIKQAAGPSGGPVTLRLARGEDAVEFKGVWVLRSAPGDDPRNTVALLLSDGRWRWERDQTLAGSFNERRRSGELRIVDGALTPLQVQRRVADVDYKRATLNGARPWTAPEVLEWAMRKLVGDAFTWGARPSLTDPVQDLFLKDPGASGLSRILGMLPGLNIVPNADGTGWTTIDELDRSEVRAAESAGAIWAGSGSWGVPDTSALVPQVVEVQLEREWEIRFDHEEGDSGTRPRDQPGREPPRLENVAPVTDTTLEVGGKTMTAGTYVPVGSLLAAIAAKGDAPGTIGALDRTRLLRWTLAGMSGLLRLYVSSDPPGATDLTWMRRINALGEHFRSTFRVYPQWMDKIGSVRAVRAAVVDVETGTRARSDAYFDHVVKPSYLGLAKDQKLSLAWSVTSWAENLRDAKVAPAEVEVLDEHVGIIKVVPRPDLFGFAAEIAMGVLSSPCDGTAGATYVLWNQVQLVSSWKLSVVLTVTQAVPADERRFRVEKVDLAEALKRLPSAPAPTAAGPVFRVTLGDVTARHAWLDERRAEILEAFWSGQAPPDATLTNPEQVRDAAVAQAARVITPLLPRGRGQFKVSLNPRVLPTGNLRAVTHGVSYGGPGESAAWTQLTMPATTVPPSLLALLPEATRRALARIAIEE